MAEDDVKPWTVRGIPPEVRNAALSAAKRSGLGVGDWLDRAIRHYVQHEKNAALETSHPTQRPARTTETATKEAAELVGLIGELAAAGAPPPKGVAQQAYGLIRERLKALKAPAKAIPAPAKTEE